MTDAVGPIRDHATALDFLFNRIDYERTRSVPYHSRRFKLNRMVRLLELLGNPGQDLPIVHIAGTKGKGSTAQMVASVLNATGLRTGLYTSPHLERLEERFAVAGRQCTSDQLVSLLATIQPAVQQMDQESADRNGGHGPTYFEITTAAALLHFRREDTDCVVLEVGLGGRLDSTNVCSPIVSVITSISFDHMKQLGKTLAKIAGEKAGIIKRAVPVVTGVTEAEPLAVIAKRAEQLDAPLVVLNQDFHFEYFPHAENGPVTASERGLPVSRMDYSECVGGGSQRLNQLELGMLGRHQAANAAVAVATLNQLRLQGWKIDDQAIREGLRVARCPARIEVVSHRPTVVLDAAHNEASVAALLQVLNEYFPSAPRVLVFASSVDKDAPAMLKQLVPQFDRVIFTRYLNNPRAAAPEQLATLVERVSTAHAPKMHVASNPQAAWELVQSSVTPDHLVCVAGSFFLAAEVRRQIQGAATGGLTLQDVR
jgi:dihydrofolate synthase/folylpolyglutamate synthase